MEKYKIEPCFEPKGFCITKLNNKGKYSFCFYVQSLREANWYLKHEYAIEERTRQEKEKTLIIGICVFIIIVIGILTLK